MVGAPPEQTLARRSRRSIVIEGEPERLRRQRILLSESEQIVLVAVSSAHRQAAFDAAQYMMDFLKTDAPFWKAEERGDQLSWVEARQSDNDAHAKWTQE